MDSRQFKNIDVKTVEGSGDEWSRFDQTGMADEDTQRIFESYFSIFPRQDLPEGRLALILVAVAGRS